MPVAFVVLGYDGRKRKTATDYVKVLYQNAGYKVKKPSEWCYRFDPINKYFYQTINQRLGYQKCVARELRSRIKRILLDNGKPDLIALGSQRMNSLVRFIEIKTEGGGLTESQIRWILKHEDKFPIDVVYLDKSVKGASLYGQVTRCLPSPDFNSIREIFHVVRD